MNKPKNVFEPFKEAEEEKRYQINYDSDVAKVLYELNAVIAISTYQAGKVIFITPKNEKRLNQTPVSFRKPMGIALYENRMAVATLDEIQIFADSKSLAKSFPYSDIKFDSLYFPRATYYCGETDLHDLSFGKGGIWAVNTRFSCLSTYDTSYSFTPRWKPPFITDLKPQDRCHLNGMAMIDFKPAYVTALGKTDIPGGWREHITRGGLLMAAPSGEIILENLAMPHSPRIIDGELYLLQSANGDVIKVDTEKRTSEHITNIPGFIRGMAHYKGYLFIGLSKIRKTSKTFNKLPVSDMSDYAGVVVYDLTNREKVGEIRYDSTVEEIFDVQIIPDTINPGLIGPEDERHKMAVSTKNQSFWKRQKEAE